MSQAVIIVFPDSAFPLRPPITETKILPVISILPDNHLADTEFVFVLGSQALDKTKTPNSAFSAMCQKPR